MSPARGESPPVPRSPDRRSASGPWRLATEPLGSLLRLSRGGSSAGNVLVATERLSREEEEARTPSESEQRMQFVQSELLLISLLTCGGR